MQKAKPFKLNHLLFKTFERKKDQTDNGTNQIQFSRLSETQSISWRVTFTMTKSEDSPECLLFIEDRLTFCIASRHKTGPHHLLKCHFHPEGVLFQGLEHRLSGYQTPAKCYEIVI
jgi:hypothetical protein